MTSARILLQRALRLNKDSPLLWHEYFKLELLWITKIKERRRVLFGDSSIPKIEEIQKQEVTKDEDSTIDLPKLKEEDGVEETALERDPTINAASGSTTQDPAMVMGRTLTPMQKALIEIAIPRAIYRNAIKGLFLIIYPSHYVTYDLYPDNIEIPNELEFRLGFLKIYQTFGSDTKLGQDELYESLRNDFPSHPIALSILAERHLAGVLPSNPAFPTELKKTVDDFQKQLNVRI
jgi:U3 small nucleolar RNA-associated protein 6